AWDSPPTALSHPTVAVAHSPGRLTEAPLRMGSKKPQVVARPRRALSCLGAASPLSDHHGERGPGFRRQLCATATARSRRRSTLGPWSFPWSLIERISHHLRTPQGRSRASRDLRAPRFPPSSPVSPITGECRKAPSYRGLSPAQGVLRRGRRSAETLAVRPEQKCSAAPLQE